MSQSEKPGLTAQPTTPAAVDASRTPPASSFTPPENKPPETVFLEWALIGPNGLRVGWSAALFVVLSTIFVIFLGTIAAAISENVLLMKPGHLTAASAVLNEASSVLGILAAALFVSRLEHRRLRDYYLSASHGLPHFLGGLATGFAALSILIGTLYGAGFLHFGPETLSAAQVLQFGALWATGFLLTGFFEEGSFRCYLLYTFARGTNYWWASGTVTVLCLITLLNPSSNGPGGVYLAALLGAVPCLYLDRIKSPAASFWQAAWLSSTGFGFVHTFNDGESWLGIFSAAAIGFVFCVSIRLTGSAWWAIGFHSAWDWAQTFFYGTPDSGLAAQGHYLTTTPVGATLWSGGADGPEGSLLVLPIIALVLVGLVLAYRGKPPRESPSPAVQPQLS